MQTWKVVHLGRPERLRDRMPVDGYNCRMEVQRPRLEFTEDCFRWRAAKQWNELSQELRQETSISIFKRLVKLRVIEERTRDKQEPD